MGPGTVVRIRNVGQREFKDSYGGTTWRVAPGGENIIPFEAACLWFGHPEAIDMGPRDRFRHDEHMRMRTKYGVYEKDDLWPVNTPKIEMFDLDGSRILTVIDDPEGKQLGEVSTELVERKALEDRMAEMQRQMETMQAYINSQAAGGPVPTPTETVPNDNPPPSVQTGGIPPVTVPEGQKTEVIEDTPTSVRVKVS